MLEFDSFHNVRVTDNTSVQFNGKGEFFRFRDGRFVALKKEDRGAYNRINTALKIKRSSVESIEEGLIAFPQNTTNYAHFIREALPILHLLNKMQVTLPIIVGQNFFDKKFVLELTKLFEKLNLVVVKKNQSLVVRDLKIVSNFRKFYDLKEGIGANLLSETRDFVQGKLYVTDQPEEEVHSDRIYISRKNVKRKIINEEPIERVLKEFGFTTVVVDDASAATQVRMFSNCNVLFGPHGAGLANELYMPTGALILEASYPMASMQDFIFFDFSQLLGHRHLLIPGVRANWDTHPDRQEDFILKPELLRAYLREVTASCETCKSPVPAKCA